MLAQQGVCAHRDHGPQVTGGPVASLALMLPGAVLHITAAPAQGSPAPLRDAHQRTCGAGRHTTEAGKTWRPHGTRRFGACRAPAAWLATRAADIHPRRVPPAYDLRRSLANLVGADPELPFRLLQNRARLHSDLQDVHERDGHDGGEDSKKMRRVCKPFSRPVSPGGMEDPCPSRCARLCTPRRAVTLRATRRQPATFHRCNVQVIWV
jgi:hypothetical protein